MSTSSRQRTPWWARLGIAAGALLLIPTTATLAAGHAVVHAAGAGATGSHAGAFAGPLNVLLVGIDPRGSHTAPLADTIIVAHLPADRQRAYLFSLPRDLVVQIPAFPENGTPTQRAKINAAMALGSRRADGTYDPAQGYRLLAQTVSDVTGIHHLDAGAIVNFGGFTKMVRALGGVKMPIDQDVVSEHRKPDGTPRDRLPECQGHHGCLRPYTGAQKTYPKSSSPVRLRPWEALDYLRQRYGLPGSDYDRQRHQRQFVEALAERVMHREVPTDPQKLLGVLQAIGSSLTFTGSSYNIFQWAAELRHLDIDRITSITLPGFALFEDGRYRGEQLPGTTAAFFAAVAQDRVAPFLIDHPGIVTVDD
jgi:anionic cell wall polymer biosynthesis LytR-Cps2A-Psr (LCP) family protein